MFTTPENRGEGEITKGLETKELDILTTVSDLMKKYELYKRAAAASGLDNSLQFISKKTEAEGQLRMLLPQAITELGAQIAREANYNQSPQEEISKLGAERTKLEEFLLNLGEETRQTETKDILDENAFDKATAREPIARQQGNLSI